STRDWSSDVCSSDLLVISPFVKEPILSELTKQGSDHVLISRLEELQRLRPKALEPFAKVYAMTDDTADEAAEDVDSTLNGVPNKMGRASCREEGGIT